MGGGGNRFEYPKYVWSPSGGWWCNPRHWRRNTAYAMIICGMLGGVMFYVSSRLERRPVPPYRFIPSQRWCKYAEEDDPRWKEYRQNQRKSQV